MGEIQSHQYEQTNNLPTAPNWWREMWTNVAHSQTRIPHSTEQLFAFLHDEKAKIECIMHMHQTNKDNRKAKQKEKTKTDEKKFI